MNTRIKKIIVVFLTACLSSALLTSVSGTQLEDNITHVTVEFTSGEGPTNPVDPEDPSVEEPGEGILGDFTIISVSDFDFRTETAFEITLEDNRYPIQTDRPNIQVVDLRGTGSGWKMQASLEEFSSGGQPSLIGSSISIANGRPHSTNITTPGPVSETDIVLVAGDTENPQDIMEAGRNAGMGLWVMRWYPDVNDPEADPYIYLNVPLGSATRGMNQSTITWILSNAD